MVAHTQGPKLRRKSLQGAPNLPATPSGPTSGHDHNRAEAAINKRRNSSFTSTSSPWFRRNSFLSPSMIQNENFSVYDSPSFFSDSASYNIISLKECQGFIFNQDLFASPYQQSRSIANERKTRALSFSKSRSRSNSRSQSKTPVTPKSCTTSPPVSQRRHTTSYHFPRPVFLGSHQNLGSAIVDDEDGETSLDPRNDSILEHGLKGREIRKAGIEESEDLEEGEEEDGEDDDDAIVNEYDEYDEFDEMDEYGGDSTNRRYKVHVTEIVINQEDSDIFPT